MNRVDAGVVGLAAAAAVLVGCSDDKGEPASATAAGGSQVSTGGSTEVKVDGKDLSGLDLKSGDIGGSGALDADGVATFPLVDEEQQPVTESVAWDHDWRSTAVTVGADLKESVESPQTRERIRDFARARLREPAGDAFLAEVLAAESVY